MLQRVKIGLFLFLLFSILLFIYQFIKNNYKEPIETNSQYSFHVLLPTIGKDSMFGMLGKLKEQLNSNDYLTVVFDGPDWPNVEKAREFCKDFKCKTNVIVEETNLGFWGHGIRNKYKNLPGDFIYGVDDDDLLMDNCFENIRKYCIDLNTVYIFKMLWKNGNITWKQKKMIEEEIGTAMGVIPMHIMKDNEYILRRGGDFDFYTNLSKKYNIEYVDEIIYLYQ